MQDKSCRRILHPQFFFSIACLIIFANRKLSSIVYDIDIDRDKFLNFILKHRYVYFFRSSAATNCPSERSFFGFEAYIQIVYDPHVAKTMFGIDNSAN